MIIGNIENLSKELYKFPAAIQKALAFLRDNDCTALEPGKYAIDGEKAFALVQRYQTKDQEQCRAETHEKYIDIQYIAQGQEYMGYCAVGPALEVEEDCLAKRDAKFYKKIFPESDILLTEGTYAILYPSDVHCPCCKVDCPAEVVKVVVKISVDSLK